MDNTHVIAHVRQELFFAAPVPLPRGRHTLSRAEIRDEQRERLMTAMTELMAANGYANVGVGELSERAGVSRASFYECFPDKQACAFTAYDRFIDVLLARLAASVDSDAGWDAFMRTLLLTYFQALQDDLVVARAFQVEMDAVGPEARRRRRTALVRFADFIAQQRERIARDDPALRPLPPRAFLGAVYAARQVVCDLLDEEHEPDLLALDADLVGWVTNSLRA